MWSPGKFIINNNAMVPVLMNLFNMAVFKTKIKVKRAKLMFLSCTTASTLQIQRVAALINKVLRRCHSRTPAVQLKNKYLVLFWVPMWRVEK